MGQKGEKTQPSTLFETLASYPAKAAENIIRKAICGFTDGLDNFPSSPLPL